MTQNQSLLWYLLERKHILENSNIMAEAFGIAAGAVGVAAAFTACIDVFEYVNLSRRFGKDHQTNHLQLSLLRLRLSRWGEAVRVYDDRQLGNPSASEAELETTKATIFQILVLLEDSQKTCLRYETGNNAEDFNDSASFQVVDGSTTAIINKMRDLALKRRKKVSTLKSVRWAVHDSAALQKLINDISHLLEQIEALFPAPNSRDSLQGLAEREVADVTREHPSQIKSLAAASDGIDPMFHKEVASIPGHVYEGVEIDAGVDGGVLNGNTVAQGFDGSIDSGATHSYKGVKISGSQGLLVQNGDRYGGQDFFSRR